MRRLKALLAITLLLISASLSITQKVEASSGEAKVYIINLDGVTAYNLHTFLNWFLGILKCPEGSLTYFISPFLHHL